MTLLEAIEARHSVRAYREEPIAPDAAARLREEIGRCNEEGGLHLQLITEEPAAFSGFLAHYGKFRGVRNYIALIGKKGEDLDERLGWYGERLVLLAQTLGLNTCWVGLTFSRGAGKKACTIGDGEVMRGVIAVGCGSTQGSAHRSRPIGDCCRVDGDMPDWFARGMEAAMLAPTAVNQQHFRFSLLPDGSVRAASTGGAYSRMDLGIARYHFACAAGEENFRWA